MTSSTAKPGHVAQATRLISSTIQTIRGTTRVPGDKSISHRSLLIASQVIGTTRISGLLEGEDVLNTASALQALGVPVQRLGENSWEVRGVGIGGLKESPRVLDMGNSGTGARLLMGLVSTCPILSFFSGDPSLSGRPMMRVITPLSQLGAQFSAREGGKLPLAVKGPESALPISYKLPVPSAQVKSAILLAGLNARGDTTVIESEPTRDHTENMLEFFGFPLKREQQADGSVAVTISGQQQPNPQDSLLEVPGDPSSAAFLAVAAIITPKSDITLQNICINPLRTGLFTTLEEMGAKFEYINRRTVCGEPVADLRIKSCKLKGVRVPASRAPSMIDEYPILAVAASYAEGETVMEGLAELKVKESDRLSAIADSLTACGVSAKIDGDTLTVKGQTKPKGGALIRTRLDHRIAMSFLVMGMATQSPVIIDDSAPIATSFPGFADLLNRLGAHIEIESPEGQRPLVIAIDGPAASGKGTLARRLAEYFDVAYLDTGSLYRAVGLKVEYSGKDPSDKGAAIEAANSIDLEDLANPRLRQEHIGKAASIVSAMPEVRDALLQFQRNVARSGRGAVLDGRDIGTVVCPDADFKFYITASMDARARRRHRELSGQGIEVVYDSVQKDLKERDERDSKRTIAPLKPAADAVVIDTSTMDANSVFEKVKRLIQQSERARKGASA